LPDDGLDELEDKLNTLVIMTPGNETTS
jgi:hypothetical protein